MIDVTTFVSCEKQSATTANVPSRTRFVAQLTNRWLLDKQKGFLLISDERGKPLADAFWGGKATIILRSEAGEKEYPEKTTMRTIVLDTARNQIYLTRYMNISTFGHIWIGYLKYEKSGEVQLHFKNVPPHQHASISTVSRWRSFSLPNTLTFRLLGSPSNIYGKMKHNITDQFCFWLPNVEGGDPIAIDVIQLTLTSRSYLIQFDNRSGSFPIFIYGFVYNDRYFGEINYHRHSTYIHDYQNHKDSIPHPLRISYPAGLFQNYRSAFDYFDGKYECYRQLSHGRHPDEFQEVDPEFDFQSIRDDSLSFSAAGLFDQAMTGWPFQEERGYRILWTVYSPPLWETIRLNSLSAHIQNQLPISIPVASFNPLYPQRIDNPPIKNYHHICMLTLGSSNHFDNVIRAVRFRYKSPSVSNRAIQPPAGYSAFRPFFESKYTLFKNAEIYQIRIGKRFLTN